MTALSLSAESIISAAREAIGTPFRHQGRLLGRGLDCAGLGVHVARRLGIEYIDDVTYGRRPSGGLFENALKIQPSLMIVADIEDRQPGDLLLLRFKGEPQHLAVFTGDTMIHSYLQARKVCEHRLDDQWIKRIVACYRFKALA